MIKLMQILNEGKDYKSLYIDRISSMGKYANHWMKYYNAITFNTNRNELISAFVTMSDSKELPLSLLKITDAELSDMAQGELAIVSRMKVDSDLMCTPNMCHRNSAELFFKNNDRYRVVTGIAYDRKKDLPFVHSWIYDLKSKLHYEITINSISGISYLGYILSKSASTKFAKVEGFR